MKTRKPRVTAYIEYVDFFTAAAKYDQRSAVIIITAKLDELLGRVITKVTLPSDAKEDDLVDGDGPLSSLGAKIKIVRRLGFMDAELAQALHLIRKIRNDFAHQPTSCQLDLAPHAHRIRRLVELFSDYEEEFRAYRNRLANALDIDRETEVIKDFYTICSILLQTLISAVHRSARWRTRAVPLMALVPGSWYYGRKMDEFSRRWREEKAQQSATPLPRAPQTGQSEGALA